MPDRPMSGLCPVSSGAQVSANRCASGIWADGPDRHLFRTLELAAPLSDRGLANGVSSVVMSFGEPLHPARRGLPR